MSAVLEPAVARASFHDSTHLLSDALLDAICKRAAAYDRENEFFSEDLSDLRDANFLRASVPVEFGGLGLTLPELQREQARLAARAPSTALAPNMHLYWVGAALHLYRRGDLSAQWIREEAGAGKASRPAAVSRATIWVSRGHR